MKISIFRIDYNFSEIRLEGGYFFSYFLAIIWMLLSLIELLNTLSLVSFPNLLFFFFCRLFLPLLILGFTIQ